MPAHSSSTSPSGPSGFPLTGPVPDTRTGRLLDPDRGFDGDPAGPGGRVRALLLGGAIGDAIAYGGPAGPLRVSAVTQLNLYTLDGLLEALEWANAGQPADETACLWLAYLRWLRTQDTVFPDAAPSPLPRWLDGFGQLHARRCPDRTTLEALGSGSMGEVERPVLAEAMGAGTIMRAAPFGLLPVGWRSIATMTINASAITHGHSEAQVAAVGYALAVQATINAGRSEVPGPITAGAAAALEVLPGLTRPGERTITLLRTALDAAREPASHGTVPDSLGDGGTAPSALARGVWAAVTAERQALAGRPAEGSRGREGTHEPAGQDQLTQAVSLVLAGGAARAGGTDPACTVAGALTGAGLGGQGIPDALMQDLDVLPIIEEAARRWCLELGWETPATA